LQVPIVEAVMEEMNREDEEDRDDVLKRHP
jgi:hypothetical protein